MKPPRSWALALLGWAIAVSASAQDRLPIFDTHMHYSQPAWAEYPAERILEIMTAAGVPRAAVSSSPDEGTLMLLKAAPQRVVPFLRPYRDNIGPSNWLADPGAVAYLEDRLRSGRYAGIGEFHHYDDNVVPTPTVRRVIELSIERELWLKIHSGAAPVRAFFALEPRAKILWAHAGMSESAEVVGAMLDRYEKLWTEVSFRAGDIAPGGRLAPAWRETMMRHKDRIMIGTDTYVTPRWGTYAAIVDEHRRWLAQLPRDVAEAIAYRNAVRLFGAGDARAFTN